VSLLLPQTRPSGEQTAPPVPVKPPAATAAAPAVTYEPAWQKPIESDSAVHLTVGPTHLFVADAKSRLIAMSPADSAEVWSKDLPTDKRLATGDGMVFVVSGEKLYALDEKTGAQRWTASPDGTTNGPTWSPGIVVLSAGVEIIAFRTADGSEIWRKNVGADSVAPLAVESGLVLTPLANRSIVALDAVTGMVRKQMLLGAQPNELATADNRLFFGAEDGFVYAYRVNREDPEWAFEVRVKPIGAPVVDDRCVYVTLLDNTIRGFKRGPGTQCWSPRTLPGRPAAGPMLSGKTLVVPLTNASLVVVDTKDGRIRGPKPGETDSPASPAAATLQAIAATPDVSSIYMVAVGDDQRRLLTARRRK
jgi:outer membrane protein assembly factor BamB